MTISPADILIVFSKDDQPDVGVLISDLMRNWAQNRNEQLFSDVQFYAGINHKETIEFDNSNQEESIKKLIEAIKRS